MAKWGRGSKVPGYGRLLSKFDQSFSYSGGLIESCPKPGTFDHLPPFAIHILNPLDMRNHRDPLFMGQKCTQYGRETNTSQVFGNCGSLSPPPIIIIMTMPGPAQMPGADLPSRPSKSRCQQVLANVSSANVAKHLFN